MSIATARAGDESRALVVSLFGDVVVGAVTTGDTGKGELVIRWVLQLRSLAFADRRIL